MTAAPPRQPSQRTQRPWIVIAGGGTAGHVLPALSVATELVRRGLAAELITFVGSTRGIEARLVPDAGFAVTLLPGRGIQRKISAQNIVSMWGLVCAAVMATTLLARRRPAVVLSVGGYASVPCVVAAVILRIPLVVAEQNARAGVANRMAARWARATAVSFVGVNLPRAVFTGNPVRPELVALAAEPLQVRRHRARATLGIDAEATALLVFGGSLGARKLNEATCAFVSLYSNSVSPALAKLVVHHVSGEGEFATVAAWEANWRQRLDAAPGIDYRLVRYEQRMDLAMAAADVCLCRAGASSVADLAIMGTPALLVPLPIAAEDHQTLNAQAVVDDGAGILIPDAELTGERLAKELTQLLGASTLNDMAAAQQRRSRPGASAAVVELLLLHAARPLPAAPLSPTDTVPRNPS